MVSSRVMTTLVVALTLVLQFATSAAQQPYPPQPGHSGPAWFINVAPEAGLNMLNVNGGITTKQYIIETTGSGVAILDYDHDGWQDILLVNGAPKGTGRNSTLTGAPSAHLFRNLHNGRFADVTHAAGLDHLTGWGQGVCVGDYDNDGYDDLFVTYYGHNHLLHNERNGTFKDVSEAAGVAGTGRAWGTGCTFVDYDRDGKLDLLVANYVDFDVDKVPKPGEGVMCIWKGTPVMCGPRGLPSTPNILYRNLGGGHFENVSKTSGIEKTDGHYCFSATTLDYNGDGWPDIFVACDSTPSILYRNNHDGTFTDQAAQAGVAFDEDGREQAGMGVTVGDYLGNKLEDLFKTNFSDDTSSLYRNMGDGTFTSQIAQAGLGLNTKYLGWGTMFFDPGNDGLLDLIVANGHVYPEVDTAHLGSTYKEPRLFYRNEGNGRFTDLSLSSGPGLTTPASSRGLATADLWNDGRTEIVINNMSDQPMLLVNVKASQNHWLTVETSGTVSNRDGVGAGVVLHTGSKAYTQEVRNGGSYLSSSDLRLHFGLGSADKVTGIEVRWPGGLKEQFPSSGVDRVLILKEGTGTALPSK